MNKIEEIIEKETQAYLIHSASIYTDEDGNLCLDINRWETEDDELAASDAHERILAAASEEYEVEPDGGGDGEAYVRSCYILHEK